MFNSQVPIVDKEGRPTRVMMLALQRIIGSSGTSVEGRVTSLETSVSSLLSRMSAAEASSSAQAVTIASHTASIADLQVNDVWVTPWP